MIASYMPWSTYHTSMWCLLSHTLLNGKYVWLRGCRQCSTEAPRTVSVSDSWLPPLIRGCSYLHMCLSATWINYGLICLLNLLPSKQKIVQWRSLLWCHDDLGELCISLVCKQLKSNCQFVRLKWCFTATELFKVKTTSSSCCTLKLQL